MKVVYHKQNLYLIRFDKGEEIISGLVKFCEEKKIGAGFFSGIGATSGTLLSHYNLDKKEYTDKEIKEKLEIASLAGNIAKMGEKTIVHAHGIFSNSKMEVVAGHIKKLVVSATGEIILERLDSEIKREYSEEIGLNLLK